MPAPDQGVEDQGTADEDMGASPVADMEPAPTPDFSVDQPDDPCQEDYERCIAEALSQEVADACEAQRESCEGKDEEGGGVIDGGCSQRSSPAPLALLFFAALLTLVRPRRRYC